MVNEKLVKIAKMAIDEPDPEEGSSRALKRKLSTVETATCDPATIQRLQEQLTTYSVGTQNQFDVLSVDDEEVEKMDKATENHQKKKVIPPPIVIRSKPKSYTEFINIIIGVIGQNNFTIKTKNERTLVFCKVESDRLKLIQYLQDAKLSYHSFTPKNERKSARVIYDLETDSSTDELLAELKIELNIDRISRLKNTRAPIYLVIFNENYAIKKLNKEHCLLGHTRIKWAP